MDLELQPFSFNYTSKTTVLDVVFQPFSMLDFDETITFEMGKGTHDGRSHSSMLPGWKETLYAMKVDIKPNHTVIFKEMIDKKLINKQENTLYLPDSMKISIPDGPRYVNPNAKAYLLEKFENDECYDATLVIPLPKPCGQWALEGVHMAINPETKETVAMLVTNGINTAVAQTFFPVVLPKVCSVLTMDSETIMQVKLDEGIHIDDEKIREIALGMDTLVIPPLFNVDGIPYAWIENKMVDFYKAKVIDSITIRRNLINFASEFSVNVEAAIKDTIKPPFMSNVQINRGNAVSIVHCDLMFGKYEPLEMLRQIHSFVNAITHKTMENQLCIALKNMKPGTTTTTGTGKINEINDGDDAFIWTNNPTTTRDIIYSSSNTVGYNPQLNQDSITSNHTNRYRVEYTANT